MEPRHGTELVQGAVYEFHKPDPGQRIQVEIVFMHGLQVSAADLKDAYYKTWRTADKSQVWPETWLKAKYPNARILSLAYDSSARQTREAGNMGPYLLGESLLAQMVSSAANIGQNDCPVVLVGHSLGGLIAKEIIVRCGSDRANAKYQNLLLNLKAVFFYATPHGGSDLTDSRIVKVAGLFPFLDTSSLVEYLKPKGTDRTHTQADFLRAVNKDCKFYVVAEGRQTELIKVVGNRWIVDENSARFPGLHEFVMLDYADHMTVCKPQSEKDTGYLKLIKCVDEVVEEESRRSTVVLSVLDPIGIDRKIDDISSLLERPEVSMVGLFGMGGTGKTTLSKKFYNLKAWKYVKSCYLENVKSKEIEDVQKDLLRGLCGETIEQGRHVEKKHLDMIKECLLEQKVLVVIDDVITKDCLQDLQVFHALESGSESSMIQSKVIVTGRDRAVLPHEYLNSGKAVIEPVIGIKDPQGSDLELFLRCAFHGVPQADDKENVEIMELLGEAQKIVQLCNGLPLSLEVLGKFLNNSKGKDENLEQWKETWVEAYERLQKAQSIDGNKSEKLWNSLRMSYDDLDDLEKTMFLDFACVFSEIGGVEKRLVERIWDSRIGVDNLVSNSLLKEEGEHFVMHDQLRDMGRYILLKETLKDYEHPIYLWHGYKNHSEAYKEFKSKRISESDVPYIASLEQEVEKNVHQYSKLRLLHVTGCNTPSVVDDCVSQCSEKLKWLHLEECSGVTKIGIQKLCSFGGLQVLQLFSCDTIVELPGNVDKLTNLAELEVISCSNLRSLPDTLGKLRKLKRLVVSWSGLLAVPDSVGELPKVEYLSFEGCGQLTEIHGTQIPTQNLKELKLPIVPTTSLRRSLQLQRLVIENGRGATEFPQDFFKTDMPKLEVVKWSNVASAEVVLKNPDGSQLVLERSELLQITDLEVRRRPSDGSISQLSVARIHPNDFRVLQSLQELLKMFDLVTEENASELQPKVCELQRKLGFMNA